MQAEEGENMGTAYNIAYLASVLRTSTKISLRGTSDTLNPLYEIMLGFLFDKERCGGLAQCLKNNKNLNKLWRFEVIIWESKES